MAKKIRSALISVYHKDGLEEIVEHLKRLEIKIYSTGGTAAFLRERGAEVEEVENVTGYPSILGGRVKTLHPKVFGGILAQRSNEGDSAQLTEYDIPEIDLVIVDLYPFEETVAQGLEEHEVIEKIDIGGISLIRAAAKNYQDVVIVASRDHYEALLRVLEQNDAETSLQQRKRFAAKAFAVSSNYDTAIFHYFNRDLDLPQLRISCSTGTPLRYGENPHQKATFFGSLNDVLEQLHGKELSYNNLTDIDAAVNLIREFEDEEDPTFAIIKHTNSCGLATRKTLKEAYDAALAGDPVSAFGGVFICNRPVDRITAEALKDMFVEVFVAPDFEEDALMELRSKKNRILLKMKAFPKDSKHLKTLLNGIGQQEKDLKTEALEQLDIVTKAKPSDKELRDLIFAIKAVKHLKSNAIALVRNRQLIGIGTGQTSRIDALKQAIAKAREFKFKLEGAVMASDAFFPFPDCVEIADQAGISAVVQPGGSIRDEESLNYCNEHKIAMAMTGIRHFKH